MQIDCTGDACAGDVVTWREAVFSGSFRSPKYAGDRTVTAKIISDSYGAKKQQHTFTLSVISSSGVQPLEPGSRIFRKARNVYGNGCTREPWPDEPTRAAALAEKHQRGAGARANRALRRSMEIY